MNLSDYIDAIGVNTVAILAEVTRQTVYNWKNLKVTPTPNVAFLLITESNGLLSWESIYQPFYNVEA